MSHDVDESDLKEEYPSKLRDSLRCQVLLKLLLQLPRLTVIPHIVFEHMPLLEVLDLSGTSIQSLPSSISCLSSLKELHLRDCSFLIELPIEIGMLTKLKLLDMEGSEIIYIPKEIVELTNLEVLRLCLSRYAENYIKAKNVNGGAKVPRMMISELKKLKELCISVCQEAEWWEKEIKEIQDEICDLENLEFLKWFLPTEATLKQFLDIQINRKPAYEKLSNFTFTIGQHTQLTSCLPRDLEKKFAEFENCLKWIYGEGNIYDISKIMTRAKALFLSRHWTIVNLSALDISRLKYFVLAECNEMETLVNVDDLSKVLENNKKSGLESLEYLSIHYMEKLKSIWEGPIGKDSLSRLRILALHTCLQLTTIFTPRIAQNLSCLVELTVEECPKIRSLISTPKSEHGVLFPSLERIFLIDLPELDHIFGGRIVLEKLENLMIYNCVKLRRLSEMELPHIQRIKGESKWWNSLYEYTPTWENVFEPLKEKSELIEQLLEATNSLKHFHDVVSREAKDEKPLDGPGLGAQETKTDPCNFPLRKEKGILHILPDAMEISLLKLLINNISRFVSFSARGDDRCSEIVEKCRVKIEEVVKLVKPVLEYVVNHEVASEEVLQKEFEGISRCVDEVRAVFEECHPFMSKVYFVLKVESLFAKVQTHGLDIFDLLRSCEGLPVELSSASLEHRIQKIKHMGFEKLSAYVSKAIRVQVEGSDPSSDLTSKIADLLSLQSNKELLIELVALENLKESAEQAEKNEEVEYIEEMIALVTYIHDCFVEMKQSQSNNPVLTPPDFCCPLSLELMTDPVIVASGQTYERRFIRDWIDLGLTICPKTMQSLVHTNLIPNYTVKALIANWCESNHVKLPDAVNSVIYHKEASLVHHVQSSELEKEDDDLAESVEIRRMDLGGPSTVSPPQVESSGGGVVDNGSQEVTHEESLPQATAESQPAIAAPSASPQRDRHAYLPRFGNLSRKQIWRRPSENFVTDIRADLAGVETQVKKLVDDLSSSSVDVVKNATGELRLLSRSDKDIRNVIANSGAIPLIISLLRSSDQKIQENSVTVLLNLSINDSNKAVISNAYAIEPLIHVLKSGSSEAKENSAATLFSLSVMDDNKVKIGRSGAIEQLVDLLGNGTPRGKKDAATALFNLSTFHENKVRIVQVEGAIRYLIELMDPATGMVDKGVAVLSNLATLPEGRKGIGQEGGIPMLVDVVELGSAQGKENAAAALLQLCTNSSRFCNVVLQEGAIPPLVALSHSGTPRAKEKVIYSFYYTTFAVYVRGGSIAA